MTTTASKKKTSQVSDLITMGIFIALFIALMFVGGMAMGALPIIMIIMPLLMGLFGGLIFTVMLGKVQRSGAFLISSVILGVGLIGMAPGGSMCYMTIIGGVLAEILYRVLGKKSFKAMSVAYSVYMLCFAVGLYMPFVWMKEAYLAQYAGKDSLAVAEMGTSFINLPVMVGLCVATVVVAVLGCFWGKRLTQKQFTRAGIV